MSDRYTLHSTKRSYIQQQIQDVVHALKKHGKWTNALAKFQELRDRLYVTTGKSHQRKDSNHQLTLERCGRN